MNTAVTGREWSVDWIANENARFIEHSREALMSENSVLKAKLAEKDKLIAELEQRLHTATRLRAYALQAPGVRE